MCRWDALKLHSQVEQQQKLNKKGKEKLLNVFLILMDGFSFENTSIIMSTYNKISYRIYTAHVIIIQSYFSR